MALRDCLLTLSLLGLSTAAGAAAADDQTSFAARVQELKANPDGLAEPARLHALFDVGWEYVMVTFPEFATLAGYPGQNHRWTDNSPAAIARRKEELRWPLEVLDTIDRSALDEADQLNYDLYRQTMESNLAGMQFPAELLAINQLGGIQQNVAQTFAVMPTRNRADYEDILSRLEGVGKQVDNTILLLRMGIEKGVTPPRVTLGGVAQQITNQIPEDPLASPLLRAFTSFPDTMPAAEQRQLEEAATAHYQETVRPAFQRLLTFWNDSYLPAARATIAHHDLPEGQAWYRYLVRSHTTTDLTPQEIHDIGRGEVKRIRTEMERVIDETGFEGDFKDFCHFLLTDPQFFFERPEDLITAYRDIAKQADAASVKLFATLPRLPYGVKPVPAYAEKDQTTAYYEPGSPEAGRPGYFYANTYDLSSRPKWGMETLTLHEAVPGHHFQIAIAQELPEVPAFRRWNFYTAFVEGWGLYAESLGKEMGFFTDPYMYFGRLSDEMLRAIRLVVDTGMHSLGWSRQQAVDFFKANTPMPDIDINVEVDRYIVNPGQALAYKIGELRLQALRAHANEELGDDFDIRRFHDQLLGAGALPLEVLEKRIRAWVAAEKARLAG